MPAHNWLILRLNRLHVARMAGLCKGALLDVGCGEKPYEALLSPHVDSYVGLEHPATPHASDRVDVWGSADELPFADDSFDTIVSFHVLEHTNEPPLVLAEMARVLRPGGALLLAVPFVWGIHEAPRDFYRFTPYGLEYLLRKAGFREIDVRPLCGYWATAGLRLCYALQRAARGPIRFPLAGLFAVIQLLAWGLDRLDNVETDAAGYAVSAVLNPPRAN
jgi:SAM-dependent methyltransferase